MWSRKPIVNNTQRILVARKGMSPSPMSSGSAYGSPNYVQPKMGYSPAQNPLVNPHQHGSSPQAGYQITVRAGNFSSPNPNKLGEPMIGHSSVVLHSPAGMREYNVAVNNYDQVKGQPLRSLTTGVAARVERTHQPISMTQSSEVTIPITGHQYLQAKLYAERQANMGSFTWHAGNNCVHFTHNTVKAAGIHSFSTSPFAGPEHTRAQINKLKTKRW